MVATFGESPVIDIFKEQGKVNTHIKMERDHDKLSKKMQQNMKKLKAKEFQEKESVSANEWLSSSWSRKNKINIEQ